MGMVIFSAKSRKTKVNTIALGQAYTTNFFTNKNETTWNNNLLRVNIIPQ